MKNTRELLRSVDIDDSHSQKKAIVIAEVALGAVAMVTIASFLLALANMAFNGDQNRKEDGPIGDRRDGSLNRHDRQRRRRRRGK